MSGVDVLAELDRRIAICRELCVVRDITDTPPGLADLIEARAAVAELITEAQRVVEGTTGDLHYLRAALARVGGAA